jgi:uncharacterized membrane protein YuzA (DUF378 family)
MFSKLKKGLNIICLFFLVLSALSFGFWGFFQVEVLPTLMGESLSQFFYCLMGLFGLYGVHLFIEYSKNQLERPFLELVQSENEIPNEGPRKD